MTRNDGQPGKPREIRWSWKSKNNYLRTGYMAVDGRISLADLNTLMAEVAPGVNPADIKVNWATAVWDRDATDDEIAKRTLAEAAWEARHEKWERETLAKLTAKYGSPT